MCRTAHNTSLPNPENSFPAAEGLPASLKSPVPDESVHNTVFSGFLLPFPVSPPDTPGQINLRTPETVCVQHETAESTKKEAKNPLKQRRIDLEDFIVSNNLLPLGSLGYLLFCTSRYGWGWKNFIAEADAGKGAKFPQWSRIYVSFILPAIVLFIFIMGYIQKFVK